MRGAIWAAQTYAQGRNKPTSGHDTEDTRTKTEAEERCTMKIASMGAMTVLFIVFNLHAQTAIENKPKDPDYVNQFFLLDKTGNLTPLERGTARASTKVHGLGFGGADASYVIPDEHSPVRVRGDEMPRFVVKMEKHDIDPATVVQFYSVKTVKNQRQLQIVRARFGGAKSKMQDSAVPFDVTKYSDASIIVTPRQALPPGEYLLTIYPEHNNGTVYCFGVS
jgi:hypothetical protein